MKTRIMGAKWKQGVDTSTWRATNYKSLAAFLKHLEENKETKTNKNSAYNGSEHFTGTANFDEALELLRTGSDEIKEGLKKSVKLAVEKLNKELNTKPEGYVADVHGLFFDVSRVIEGEPECWYREPWDKVRKPRLQIPVIGSYNASFSKEQAIKNAAEIIALVKALESAGFECEMTMVFAANGAAFGVTDRNSYQAVMIKNYDETFNWNKLSAMLHPSFFRRLIFRDVELMYPNNLNGGYGTAASAEAYFENGESMLNIAKKDSIEKFKKHVLYTLKGGK